MKNLLLFLLIIPLVNYSQSLTRGEIIDKGLSQIQPLLPYDFENGVIWTKVINEDNLSRVYVYQLSREGILLVIDEISKTQIINDSKALNAFKIARDNKINCIWRYYYNETLIKEIIVYPTDWTDTVS